MGGILHATALADIEDSVKDSAVQTVKAFGFDVIDPCGLDLESLKAIQNSSAKTELVFHWVQEFIVEGIGTDVLSIPAPVLSRAFQEMASGMVAFHDAMKLSYIPFPFP